MMKKYLILMMGLFLVLGSVVFAREPNEFQYAAGGTVAKNNPSGCRTAMPGDVTAREYFVCLNTVTGKDKNYILDKRGNPIRLDFKGDKEGYLVHRGMKDKDKNGNLVVVKEELIGVANKDGVIKIWIYMNDNASEDASKLISWKKINQEEVLAIRSKDYKNSKTIDQDGDGITNNADKDLHPDAEDKDGDGVIDSEDEDPNDKTKGQKKNPDDPKNQSDEYDDSTKTYDKCLDLQDVMNCDSRGTCEQRKKCRENYESRWRNSLLKIKKNCPLPMTQEQINKKYNCEEENKQNAIKEAQENNTQLQTQVMNLKEYCESRKGESGKGLVKYDGVCDKTDGATALFQMMDEILKWLRNIIIIIGSALLFWGGVLYVKSAAEPKEKENAKKLMTRVAIGMIFVLFAFAIVQLILDTFADGGVKGKYSGLEIKSKTTGK